MIGIEVTINGKRLLTAGVGDLGVLLGVVRWLREHTEDEGYADLEICGHAMPPLQHLSWGTHPLKVGDEIVIRMIETNGTDDPVEVIPLQQK